MNGSLASPVAAVGRPVTARLSKEKKGAAGAAFSARHAVGGREARLLADSAAQAARRARSAGRHAAQAGVGSFFGRRGQQPPEEQPASTSGPAMISIRKALLSVPPLELSTLKKGVSDDCLGAMQARRMSSAPAPLASRACVRRARLAHRARRLPRLPRLR